MKLENINYCLRKIGFVLVIKSNIGKDGILLSPTEIYFMRWKNYLNMTKVNLHKKYYKNDKS